MKRHKINLTSHCVKKKFIDKMPVAEQQGTKRLVSHKNILNFRKLLIVSTDFQFGQMYKCSNYSKIRLHSKAIKN